ncbi:MAG TPA: hypothetical protein VFV11_10235 [Solimonas sp.]|nr:hypothetical protein [Solimonas sp.]
MKHVLIPALLLLALPAMAQDEMPAVSTAVTPAKPPRETSGTVLVGDRDETPYGLYFFPWRESKAETDIDRPARLLQEKLLPLDEDVFLRQVEYHGALSGALKSKNVVTPVGR